MKIVFIFSFFLALANHAHAAQVKVEGKSPDRGCKTESDCVATCGLGGVSTAWFKANGASFQDCEDGCMGWGQYVKCTKGKCTVYKSEGKESENCNAKTYRTLIVPSDL